MDPKVTTASAEKTITPAMQKLAARTEAAKKKLAATQALMTDDDREEARARDELAKIESEEREAAAEKRASDLARRFEACCDATPGGADVLRALAIKGFPDYFVVRRNGPAHAKWEKSNIDAVQNKKLVAADISRAYAIDSVLEWNGRDLDDSTVTHELNAFLTTNSGIVSPIISEALELNGVLKEARKSTG